MVCEAVAEKCVLGIDVSKETLDMNWDGRRRSVKVSNDRKGFKKVVEECRKRKVQLVVFEATGGLEHGLHVALHEAGVPAALTNPFRVRRFADADGQFAKSDPIDSGMIWLFGVRMNPKPSAPRNALQQQLHLISNRRSQLVEMRNAEQNRLDQASEAVCSRSIKAILKVLDREIEKLDQELDGLVRSDPWTEHKAQIIDAIDGMGRISAVRLVASCPELGQMNTKQCGALAGLAPFVCDSGKYKGQRRIRGGRARIRQALFMPALTALWKFAPTRRLYERLVEKGKKKMQAVVACMRKLLVIINARVKEAWAQRQEQISPGLG